MAAAVYDPDPSFCRWFVEPALYAFGRRRVMTALLGYLRTGTTAEIAGAQRAWYCAHLPLRADRSPAYAPSGSRDPALDEVDDLVGRWLESSSTQHPAPINVIAVSQGDTTKPETLVARGPWRNSSGLRGNP